MTIRKYKLRLCLALASLAVLPAAAQGSPWYVGISAGGSTTDSGLYDNRELPVRTSAPVQARGVFRVNTSFDNKDSALRALVGYRFSPYLSLEGAYADYGTTHTHWTFERLNAQLLEGLEMDVDRSVKAFGADLVASIPVLDRLSVLGRAGYFRAETKAETSTPFEPLLVQGPFFSDNEGGRTRSAVSRQGVLHFGLGLAWQFTDNLGTRLEWERLSKVGRKFSSPPTASDTGEANLDAWSIGLVWRF
jgi:opacity protein-like surface antigen